MTGRRALTSLERVNARHLSTWLLVGAAVFVVLGHVCALPVHAHAGMVTTHAEDHPEHGSDGPGHGGSCEALSVTLNIALPALPAARVDIALLLILLTAVGIPPAAPGESPPLFLLHSVLRI